MGLEFTTEVSVCCPHCHKVFETEVDVDYEPEQYP
jgi:hypothetical protein